MFIIVPKHRKEAQASVVESHPPAEEKQPVRVGVACDPCRVKKTKCNAEQPCKTCRRRGTICVYSRSIERDSGPLSAAKASLLQHQQRRMCTALQQMASIIAKLETGAEREPSSFSVVELLEQHAPHSIEDDQEDLSTPTPSSRQTKRRRETSPPSEPALGQMSSGWQPGPAPGTAFQQQMPFELQPAPGHAANAGANADQAYETMMTLMRYVNGNESAFAMDPATDVQIMGPSDQTNVLADTQNVASAGSRQNGSMAQFDFMNLVDWELSLANLQNIQDFSDTSDIPPGSMIQNYDHTFGS